MDGRTLLVPKVAIATEKDFNSEDSFVFEKQEVAFERLGISIDDVGYCSQWCVEWQYGQLPTGGK